MSLHISTEKDGAVLIVRVAGRLDSVGIGQLWWTCREASSIRLDLTQLHSADEAATDVLAALREDGAELVGVTPYIDLLLRSRHGRKP